VKRRAIYESDGPAAPAKVRPVAIPCRHEHAEPVGGFRSCGFESCPDCGAVRVPGGPWHTELSAS
jgi:hypothetical protein